MVSGGSGVESGDDGRFSHLLWPWSVPVGGRGGGERVVVVVVAEEKKKRGTEGGEGGEEGIERAR